MEEWETEGDQRPSKINAKNISMGAFIYAVIQAFVYAIFIYDADMLMGGQQVFIFLQ